MLGKKEIISILSCVLLMGCKDSYLDKIPVASVSGETFFNKARDLELFTNGFYQMLPDGVTIYSGDARAANVVHFTLSQEVLGTRTVPTSGGGWTWGYLRDINYFLANYEKVPDEAAKRHYGGVARFFRAYFYFDKLKRFGDVPWYDYVIDPSDVQSLRKSRSPRRYIVDKILEDLDWAIQNLNEEVKPYTITKYTALALESRVALYEGTYMKYRNISGYEPYLEKCAEASLELMLNSPYGIYTTGHPDEDYATLFNSLDAKTEEVILSRQYDEALAVRHAANYYSLTTSNVRPGMPKDMVNSYLKSDGSRFTDQPNFNRIFFTQEVANRDLRLSQTIRTPGYTRKGSTQALVPNLGATVTGYQVTKYVTEPIYDGDNRSVNDLPLFRYAEVLLNYAEAKAELGTITQGDIDRSIKRLRDRVNMPNLNLALSNATPCPYIGAQYPNVKGAYKGVILEIRRERRIELYMENFRWDDIVRWKSGQTLTQPIRGIYFPGAGSYDMDGNGTTDVVLYSGSAPAQVPGVQYYNLSSEFVLDNNGLKDPHPTFNNRSFNETRDYLYPVPTVELQLNTNLTQTQGW
ncbi:RagB/SusD family nutrient uptake outer membrane protein (plasmid) [Pedobacter sp. BS3]|uniref:RagB/SusD family nutrient uptake outer membrane protein n=1 Tax=Pedobacter sp. BS3 TaxID=2567937 RepID=UPI0011EDC7BA|nr:RagB/SusD family nutrient uptake outer membrane protein [Pedobacter sp. BS3]TZF86251.1 RagB/SusD family nutrient uptake outer membrane protein [Pedobacter sp. BS3]